MKVAYIFNTPRSATYKLGQMILPQLEAGTHGVDVVGMFFFDDNVFALRKGDPIGERLARVAAPYGRLLMMCDMCALARGLAGAQSGPERAGPGLTLFGREVMCPEHSRHVDIVLDPGLVAPLLRVGPVGHRGADAHPREPEKNDPDSSLVRFFPIHARDVRATPV